MSFDELLHESHDAAGKTGPEAPEAAPSTGAQLRLLTPPADHEWSLDAKTRRLGQVGVAAARAALANVTPPDAYDSAA